MASAKFDHQDESLIFASLHLPPRETEIRLNKSREERGLEPVTFTKHNKRDYKKRQVQREIIEFIPELEAEQRARVLKFHLETIQAAIDALHYTAKKTPNSFGKGEARELSNLSREFRNTLKDIGDLSPALIGKKDDEKEKIPDEEKYAEQLPSNVVPLEQPTGTDED